MEQEWTKQLFEELKRTIGTYTQQLNLKEDEEGAYLLQAVFKVFDEENEEKDCVLAEVSQFPVKPGVFQLEMNLTTEVTIKPEYMAQVERTIIQMNYYVPLGALGIFYPSNRVTVRYVAVVDQKKSAEEISKEVVVLYELMLASLRLVYPAIKQICIGELTFEEAVEKQMLLKQ
ncbi:hypothetical protein LQZ18_03800 [Lachnospiraceae bacterium ZAX-1]